MEYIFTNTQIPANSLRWLLKIDSHQNFHSFLETMKIFETLSG